jgi:hypothetical protein
MSRLLWTLMLLSAVPAAAKAWNKITPGTTTRDEVVAKFGEPTKTTKAKGLEVLVYTKEQVIKGTTQAQFKVNPETKVVERIDVYPEPEITPDDIENSYGGECDKKKPVEPCYQRRAGEGKKSYFLYVKLGLAIFFKDKDDGQVVQSFTFLPARP